MFQKISLLSSLLALACVAFNCVDIAEKSEQPALAKEKSCGCGKKKR